MTWAEVKEAQRQYLMALGYVPGVGGDVPDWHRGAGIGFDMHDNSYILHIMVKDDADIAKAEDVLERMMFQGKFEIKAVGDIVAL